MSSQIPEVPRGEGEDLPPPIPTEEYRKMMEMEETIDQAEALFLVDAMTEEEYWKVRCKLMRKINEIREKYGMVTYDLSNCENRARE